VTPAERKALAEELAREYADEWSGGPADYEGMAVHVGEVILRALDRACTPTRIQAAERAVVEAARAGSRRIHQTESEREAASVWLTTLREACGRLEDLREQAKAGECGEKGVRLHFPVHPTDGGIGSNVGTKIVGYCNLPRGHEGRHRGDLGEWEWD